MFRVSSHQTRPGPERCRFGPDRDVDRGRNVRSARENTSRSRHNACRPRVKTPLCTRTYATRRSCPLMVSIWTAANLYSCCIHAGLILSSLVPRRVPKSAAIGAVESGENGLSEPGTLSGRLWHIDARWRNDHKTRYKCEYLCIMCWGDAQLPS